MKKWILALAVCPAVLAVSSVYGGEAWRDTMKQIAKALGETVPYLFSSPVTDQKKLAEKVHNLTEITKKINLKDIHSVKYPDDDPALPYIADMFRSYLVRAENALQSGHVEYAQGVLKSSMNYCLACHTRHEAGTQFPLLDAFKEPLKKASWIERIEIEAATRQYDPVLAAVMAQLKEPNVPNMSSLDLERGARIALSILVRIKKDPVRSQLLAKAMEDSNKSTVSMKEAARQWQKDIREWQKDGGNKEAGLKEAKRLIGSSREQNSEVRNLRATVVLHDFMQTKPDDKSTAEALSLLGQSYRNLGEIGLWNIHELYFAACIDKVPHSALAESCFRDYEESVILGYSGSSGVHLPKAVRDQLSGLRAKAKAKAGG